VDACETTRQRHVAHLLSEIGEHFERVAWPAERLRAERTARLRELVGLAVERSSWHRDRLEGVDVGTLDEDALRDLPVMTKDDLMGNFDAIATDHDVRLADANTHIAALEGDAYFRDELHAVASGGSSGRRGVFVWGWDAWATVQLTALRRSLLDRIGDPELASRPPVAMIVAAENATHFTSAVSETFATGAIETHRFRSASRSRRSWQDSTRLLGTTSRPTHRCWAVSRLRRALDVWRSSHGGYSRWPSRCSQRSDKPPKMCGGHRSRTCGGPPRQASPPSVASKAQGCT
jgi:hypothetical protein